MPSEKTTALLNAIPGPDNQSLKGPREVEQFEKSIDALLAGGDESVGDLVEFLRPRSDTTAENAKARFVLRAMVIKAGEDDGARKKLAGGLAASLQAELHPEVAAFIVSELRICGDAAQTGAIANLLTHANAELTDTAAQALVTFGAVEPLRAALPKAKGRNRLIVIQNLGVLQDKQSAGAIRASLADEDQEIRLAASAALAMMGDGASAAAMVKLAKAETGYAQAQATDACLRLAERLAAAGDKSGAEKIRSQIQ